MELVLAAFAPAFGLLAFRTRSLGYWWVFAVIAAVGVALLFWLVLAAKSGNPESFEFEDITDSSSDVLGHIGSYLAAGLIDPTKSGDEVAIAVVIVALIVLIHVAAGLVHVNPLLYLVGYRTYTVATSGGTTYYLVARSDPALWTGTQQAVELPASILVEHHRSHRGQE